MIYYFSESCFKYLLLDLLYRWIIYIELLYWGDRMRWGRLGLDQ